ncbi:MAG: hypothetical protein WD872_06700 [Pirellulaceae bacterium]
MAKSVAKELDEVLAQQGSPCLSLYQPTYRQPPQQAQNPIRYRNLLKQLTATLHDRFDKQVADECIAPLSSLADDPALFKPTLDGLAVLSCPGFLRVFKLHEAVPEMALVANSFHIRPLIRIFQTTDRFQVLGISEGSVRLFEGNRNVLEELEPGDGVPRTMMEALPEEYTDPSMPPGIDPQSREGFGGPVIHVAPRSRVDNYHTDVQRFFRVVDRAMTEHHSRPTGLPLVLAALPQHHATFRGVSENPFLVDTAIDADPEGLSADEIRQRAWQLLEPQYLARLERLREEFQAGQSKHLADDDLPKLADAAAMSRVRTLLVDASKHQAGRIDVATGKVEWNGDEHEDVYDGLAELVLRRGGEVLVVPSERMPMPTGVAGIYRF